MNKINWLDHIANLLVVILGISIAFYLESYREDQGRKSQEEKYLESLIEDLEADIQSLDQLLIANERITNALVGLTDASIGRESLNDSSLLNSIFAIQYNPPFTPQRTTYESLKASGKMDLIDDFELRNSVIKLYEQSYKGTREYDNTLSEHVRDFVKPFYMKNIQFKAAYALDDSFLEAAEFKNITFAYRYLFISKNENYKKIKEEAVTQQGQLKKYLMSL